jgi:cyanophycinase-like exopeptidase
VWNDAEKHGLLFGNQDAIVDQNIYIENRIGRLINAITLPDSPSVGIGIDANAGVNIINGAQLEGIFGNNPITILDADTYHAAQTLRYNGPANTLSLRNILIHLLAPGWSYNLDSKQTSLSKPSEQVSRSFDDLSLPRGAGSLLVTSDLSGSLERNPILERFVKSTKTHDGDILIVPIGYSSGQDAETASRLYANALGETSQTYLHKRDTETSINLPDPLSGILIFGEDQSEVDIEALFALKDAWRAGIPLLAVNAGAAIIGDSYSAYGPTPSNKLNRENVIQESFLPENSMINSGLGFINVSFEPKLLSDNRWSQLISLAYRKPHILAVGLTDMTAIEVSQNGPIVLGDKVAIVLDLREASLELGENGRLVIGNGFLDVFSLGDKVQPIDADMSSEPDQVPTPELPTATLAGYIIVTPTMSPSPSPTVEPTEGPTPTKTPKPTATPLTIPPPANPGTSNLMVLFGLLIAVVILIGIGINYRRIFPKSKSSGGKT